VPEVQSQVFDIPPEAVAETKPHPMKNEQLFAYRMKIENEARLIEPGTDEAKAKGCSRPRLVFAGGLWTEWDLEFCIHGEKLRWSCDQCDEANNCSPP